MLAPLAVGSFEKLRRRMEGRPEKKEKRERIGMRARTDRRVIRPLKPELATLDAPPCYALRLDRYTLDRPIRGT